MGKRLLAYSKKEAATATSLSVRGIDYLIEKGHLRAVKIGRRVLIPSKELERLVEKGPRTCDGDQNTFDTESSPRHRAKSASAAPSVPVASTPVGCCQNEDNDTD
jgi:excisionase family DNA binding protein